MSTACASTETNVSPVPGVDNTCVVIVSYHPDPEFPQRVAAIAAQVGRVLVVDNGSNAESRGMLERLAKSDPEVELIANDANLGIAAALNQGGAAALERGYDWVLTLDQDSSVEPDLLTTLSTIYRTQEDPRTQESGSRVGVIGSNYWHAATGLVAYTPCSGDGAAVEIDTVITSGSLTSLRAFQEIGGFREEFFIDSVDNDYCLRLRAQDFRVLLSTRPLLRHPMGDQKRYRLLWRRPSCTHYSPLRHYYMTRNRLTIMKEWYARRPAWVWGEFKAFCAALLMLVLYERNKFKKLRAVALGIWHALRGRLGPLAWQEEHRTSSVHVQKSRSRRRTKSPP